MTELWAIGLVILASIAGASGPIFLKKGSKKLEFNLSILKNHYLFLGLFAYLLGTVLFIPALKGGELSVLYPINALTFVWVAFLSQKFLGEKIGIKHWFSIGLILIGITLIGVSI